ncbi:MAG TPA: hypothetical protein VKB75_08350 [Jatrophihabitans sp.]|nr:hypothetical protein [Jatrophihabitans sp.]
MTRELFGTITAGAAAGAAGTTALNAVTYLDMVLRGRPESELPRRAVETAAEKAGLDIPGEGAQRENRIRALAAWSGLATGVGLGVAAALSRRVLHRNGRLPLTASAVLTGAAAMAAADVPMAVGGLTDPRSWSLPDWLSDVVPHLAYGVVTAWTLRAIDPLPGEGKPACFSPVCTG